MLLTVDTLAFAVPNMYLEEFLRFLHLDNLVFDDTRRSNLPNYEVSCIFSGIVIHYNVTFNNEYNCYLLLSGKGCRSYETLMGSGFDWLQFLRECRDIANADFRRIDIACDDYTNLLNIQRLSDYFLSNKYSSRCTNIRFTLGSEEIFYVGSGQSPVLLRIYNKKIERGYISTDLEGKPWYRSELQLRDNRAKQLIDEWILTNNLPSVYCGHLREHIRFTKEVNNKENAQRLHEAAFWVKFLQGAERIKWVSTPGEDYNLSKLERFLFNQCSSSIYTYYKASGMSSDEFMKKFDNSDIRSHLRSDQRRLITENLKKGG